MLTNIKDFVTRNRRITIIIVLVIIAISGIRIFKSNYVKPEIIISNLNENKEEAMLKLDENNEKIVSKLNNNKEILSKDVSENNKVNKKSDLIDIKDVDDTIIVDLKYATTDNFTGKKIYESTICYLRRGTAEKLQKANEEFKKNGFTIKIYDGYRPLKAQKIFWDLVSDSRYVAPPWRGSKHNRGASVDITLVDNEGREIEMSSGFDDFTERASRNFDGMSDLAKQNLNYLTQVMKKHGFTTILSEWWHFDDSDWEHYDIQ